MKSDRLLLQKVAMQLEKWSHNPETHGRQHEPMSVLANEIFNHLAFRDGLANRCFTYRGCNFYNTRKCNRACGNYPPPNQTLEPANTTEPKQKPSMAAQLYRYKTKKEIKNVRWHNSSK